MMKYSRVYEGGELAGYKCEKGMITVYDYDVTAWGTFHRDYYANGKRFSTLRDAKKEIEKN